MAHDTAALWHTNGTRGARLPGAHSTNLCCLLKVHKLARPLKRSQHTYRGPPANPLRKRGTDAHRWSQMNADFLQSTLFPHRSIIRSFHFLLVTATTVTSVCPLQRQTTILQQKRFQAPAGTH